MTTARGIRNNNPGNIERVDGVRWQGEAKDQSSDDRFVVFTEPKFGIRAIARTLITYQDKRQAKDGSKIDTIAEIIDRWAPAAENNTSAYINNVADLMNLGTDDNIDVYHWDIMKPLVEAIITHECGTQPYSDTIIDSGLVAAGMKMPEKPSVITAENVAGSVAVVVTAGEAVNQISGSARGMIGSLTELVSFMGVPYNISGVIVSIGVVGAIGYIFYRMVIRRQIIGA